MGYPINDADITTFDYTVNFNLNTKVATFTDASVYVNAGAVTGITFTLTSPNNIVGTVTIAANGSGTIDIPTLNGGVVYGYYIISGKITDAVSNYTYVKPSLNICKPEQCDPVKNSDGCLNVSVIFFCADNKMLYQDNTAYAYKSINATTVTKSVTATDPNNVNISDAANVASFSKYPIVNGRYVFSVTNSAVYDFGDGETVTIVYTNTNLQYIAQCDINLCDVRCAVKEMYDEWVLLKGNRSARELVLKSNLSQLNTLIFLAESGIQCGQDVSETITQIETISGKSCACGCGSTTPNQITNSATQIVFQEGTGITIDQTTAGNTTTVEIGAVAASVVTSTGNTIVVTSATVAGLTTYNIEDTGKVKGESTDPTAGYLNTKLESTDGGIIIGADVSTHKTNLTLADLTWIPIVPSGLWGIDGGGRAEYSKDAMGTVRVRGRLFGNPTQLSGVANNFGITLPVGYRPSASQVEWLAGMYVSQSTLIPASYIILIASSGAMTGDFPVTVGSPGVIVSINCEFSTI